MGTTVRTTVPTKAVQKTAVRAVSGAASNVGPAEMPKQVKNSEVITTSEPKKFLRRTIGSTTTTAAVNPGPTSQKIVRESGRSLDSKAKPATTVTASQDATSNLPRY